MISVFREICKTNSLLIKVTMENRFKRFWKKGDFMKKKHQVVIHSERCVGCGLCEKDCVSGVMKVQNGKATVKQTGCIACGHCEAVCPKNAVELTGFQEESISFNEQIRLNPEELLNAIRTRRTVRVFTEKEISNEIIKQIIEAGRLAPTGGNSQDSGFIILGTKQTELELLAVHMFQKLLKVAKPVIPFLKGMEIDEHFFFKGAPLVIVLTGSAVNASLAAENMAFMAEAHGLGVLYSGFFTMCVNRGKKIRKLMQMSRKEKAVTTLVIGYPGVKYYRTARREPAKVRKL